MRCHICNKTLVPEEIKFDRDHNEFNPCFECLNVIAEVFADPLDEDEIVRLLDLEDQNDSLYQLELDLLENTT